VPLALLAIGGINPKKIEFDLNLVPQGRKISQELNIKINREGKEIFLAFVLDRMIIGYE
jgi:hypothetical protein